MTILFDSRLSVRDRGSRLLYVPVLLEWAKSKCLHLRTTPPIDGYEFAQVEAILCAIERHSGDLTSEQAHEIVANDPILKNELAANELAADDPAIAHWLLGAEAHRKWRVMFAAAIQAGELVLLDFGSKLPIETQPAPEQDTATPAPVVPAGTTDQTPDPERRLVLLRALNGGAKYARGEWSFTGIAALVAKEKADGRRRCDEKTIRADLKEAAQTERDAKNAGFATGLGKL